MPFAQAGCALCAQAAGARAPVLCEQGIEPAVPELLRSLAKRRSVTRGSGAEVLDADLFRAQLAGVADLPALQAFGGDLGVKLQG